MMRRTGVSLPLLIVLWAAGNTVAGTATGLAVGILRGGGFDSTIVLTSVLFGNVVGFTVLASSLILFPRLRELAPVARGALLGLALISGAAAGTALVFYLFPLFVLADLRQAFAIGAINGVLALIVGSVAYAYEGMRSKLAESLREVEEVRLVEARLREDAARAELAALQARINPHFFFNTLNTISSLLEEDPEGADRVVQSLADLFRYTFKAANAGPVPLAEELEFIKGYLAIESARFGDRLRVVWDVQDRARSVLVPGLILQPLVENAVAHGIAPIAWGGTVKISARLTERSLHVEVGDDGAGLRSSGTGWFEDGHGLGNVLRRITALYGEEGQLDLRPAPGGRGVVAALRLPVREVQGTRDASVGSRGR